MLSKYFLIGFVALAFTIVFTPLSVYVAHKVGAIDKPGERRIHLKPIPRLGGLAMYGGFIAAVLLLVRPVSLQLKGLLAGATLIMLVGMYDDIKGISPRTKLLGQLVAASVLLFTGYSIEGLTIPGMGFRHLYTWGGILVLFWVVALVNTVNLTDGLDGLAAGICFGACLVLLWSAVQINQETEALLIAGLAGVCLGFLFFNFHPAKVFMGDSGSMFLGFTIAAISISGLLKTPVLLGMVLPLLALGMPIFDMTFAVIRRKWKGQPISLADRGHLHHRLLDRGFTHRQAVLSLYALSAILGCAAVFASMNSWGWATSLATLVIVILFIVLMGKSQGQPAGRQGGK